MRIILILFLAGFAAGLAADVSPPSNRTARYSDPSGTSWRESGTMPLAFCAAQQAWEVSLVRDGWRFIRVIAIDPSTDRRLEIWEKNSTVLMLCLWSISPASSGYMWGSAREKDPPAAKLHVREISIRPFKIHPSFQPQCRPESISAVCRRIDNTSR